MATPNHRHELELPQPLKVLDPRWIHLIDEGLAWVGAFGEVRLVLEDGRLTGLKATRSYDALKWLKQG